MLDLFMTWLLTSLIQPLTICGLSFMRYMADDRPAEACDAYTRACDASAGERVGWRCARAGELAGSDSVGEDWRGAVVCARACVCVCVWSGGGGAPRTGCCL